MLVVKLQPHEYGEHGWAAAAADGDDAPPEFFQFAPFFCKPVVELW
jgi:hypothetical protein